MTDPFEKQLLIALEGVQADLDAIVRRLDGRVNGPEPGPGPEPEPEPEPDGWSPPPEPTSPRVVEEPVYPITENWKGKIVNPAAPGALAATTVTGIYTEGRFNLACFDGVLLQPDGAMFAVGVQDHQPDGVIEGEDYFNSVKAADFAGTLYFSDCVFSKKPGTTEWKGYGVKMHLHPQSDHSLFLLNSRFDSAREHSVYCEHVRNLLIYNCDFADTGGNAIQVTSRGGRTESGYYHGNPVQPPSGLGGSAHIQASVINARYHEFRDASEITFAGFCGPIVLTGVNVFNAISALAVWTDAYKGAWVANGKDVPWWEPRLYKDDEPIPKGMYSCPELWIDRLKYTPDADRPDKNRAAVMISGVQEVHINRFDIGGTKPAIDLDAEYGGPLVNGRVRFYDRASVLNHIGRIGSSRSGKFVAYTMDQLEEMIVS